jgi:hypothetical protein
MLRGSNGAERWKKPGYCPFKNNYVSYVRDGLTRQHLHGFSMVNRPRYDIGFLKKLLPFLILLGPWSSWAPSSSVQIIFSQGGGNDAFVLHPIVAGVALDGTGWWVVQLFFPVNVIGGFLTLVLHLELFPPPLERNRIECWREGRGNWRAASFNATSETWIWEVCRVGCLRRWKVR